MAYNYNFNPQAVPSPQPQPQQIPVQPQNIQPLFPQPQGNVYNINSTLEVANVPVGAGISVALCMPESTMYIKTMQNGNPLFYPYKIVPFTNEKEEQQQAEVKQDNPIEKLTNQIKQCFEKIETLESQLSKLQKKKTEGWDV